MISICTIITYNASTLNMKDNSQFLDTWYRKYLLRIRLPAAHFFCLRVSINEKQTIRKSNTWEKRWPTTHPSCFALRNQGSVSRKSRLTVLGFPCSDPKSSFKWIWKRSNGTLSKRNKIDWFLSWGPCFWLWISAFGVEKLQGLQRNWSQHLAKNWTHWISWEGSATTMWCNVPSQKHRALHAS